MTVKELIEKLEEYPSEMKIAVKWHSDYCEAEYLNVGAVLERDGIYLRYYEGQFRDKPKLIDVLHIY